MGEKILIVDDDENIRLLYAEELIEEGYQAITARDGKECLDMIQTDPPNTIILDIRMPHMDGLEAIGRIIETNKNISIIINTGYFSYKDDYMSRAADAYVIKSSDLSKLKSTLKKTIAMQH